LAQEKRTNFLASTLQLRPADYYPKHSTFITRVAGYEFEIEEATNMK
jgi:hypothetical protein